MPACSAGTLREVARQINDEHDVIAHDPSDRGSDADGKRLPRSAPDNSVSPDDYDGEPDSSLEAGWASSPRLPERVWGGILGCTTRISCIYFIAAIVGTFPRSLALMISHAVPQVSKEEAIDNFRELWAPCKEPGAAFPAFSSEGQFYKFLVGCDHAFFYFGTSLAYIAASSATFSLSSRYRPGRWLIRLSGCSHFLLTAVTTAVVISLLTRAPNMASLKRCDDARTIFFIMTVGLFTCFYLANGVLMSTLRGQADTDAFPRCVRLLRNWRVVVLYVLAGLFAINMDTLQRAMFDLLGATSFSGIYAPVVFCKVILLALRQTSDWDGIVGQSKTITMISFAVTVGTSKAVRTQFLDVANDDLPLIFTSSLLLSTLELASRWLNCVAHCLLAGRQWTRSKINGRTLGDILDL